MGSHEHPPQPAQRMGGMWWLASRSSALVAPWPAGRLRGAAALLSFYNSHQEISKGQEASRTAFGLRSPCTKRSPQCHRSPAPGQTHPLALRLIGQLRRLSILGRPPAIHSFQEDLRAPRGSSPVTGTFTKNLSAFRNSPGAGLSAPHCHRRRSQKAPRSQISCKSLANHPIPRLKAVQTAAGLIAKPLHHRILRRILVLTPPFPSLRAPHPPRRWSGS